MTEVLDSVSKKVSITCALTYIHCIHAHKKKPFDCKSEIPCVSEQVSGLKMKRRAKEHRGMLCIQQIESQRAGQSSELGTAHLWVMVVPWGWDADSFNLSILPQKGEKGGDRVVAERTDTELFVGSCLTFEVLVYRLYCICANLRLLYLFWWASNSLLNAPDEW